MKLKKIAFLLLAISSLVLANSPKETTAGSVKTVEKKKSSKKKQTQQKPKDAASSVPLTAFTINKILVSIYTQEDSAIITQLDLERPTLQGEKRTLEDMIFEMLVFLDAKSHKVVPDEEAIDRYLQNVQRENNLTLDQLKKIFASAGYTYDEGRHQFMIMSTVNSMIDYKIRSRLTVPEKDIVTYYNEHPEMEEPRYSIEIGFVPTTAEMSSEEVRDALVAYTHGNKGTSLDILWGDPFWINKSELAEDKQDILRLKKGQISQPYEAAGGFEIYRLKDVQGERVKAIEARHKEISDLLRRPRFEQLMTEYKKELFDNASIVYH